MIVQCRDLLAQLVSAKYNQMGQSTSPNDFIPNMDSIQSEVDDLESQTAMMHMWAMKYNAQVQ